jgi:hypothetical protein|tara:strand:+ start:1572 stop:1874 length:303 start_codon:yes stop_codon:yes gene_type:complete
MSSWGKTDRYQDAPLWSLARVFKAPVVANMGPAGSGKLFNNATGNNLITGLTIGLFNYKDSELLGAKPHTGWNLKIVGSGGRSGRTRYETLVALSDSQDA